MKCIAVTKMTLVDINYIDNYQHPHWMHCTIESNWMMKYTM